MAVSRKGSRLIVVDGVRFRWRAEGNDDFIQLVIWPDLRRGGGKIACTFGYHQTQVPNGDGWSMTRQLIITNRIVRRVILHALAKGFDAAASGEMDLKCVDGVVDISDAVRGK